MSEENDFTRHTEGVASVLGIDAKCRLMHREDFEDDGEWFPPYDEYVVRAKGKILTIDAETLDDVGYRGQRARELLLFLLEGLK